MMNVIYKKNTGVQTNTEGCILKILAYFSIFRYPLPKADIVKYLPPGTSIDRVEDALAQLVTDGAIFRIGDFYSLQNETTWVKRRREGNLRAAQLLPTAMKIGRFLSKFPFVRGVAISGSLSKMYADEKTDIDFFVITKTNRLWIARTFMHLFKKFTFLTGKQDYYCMNYYVDEASMKHEDQNIYTAMEIITLMPAGGEAIPRFFKVNDWVGGWFGSYEMQTGNNNIASGKTWMKRFLEWTLDHKAGHYLDTYLMKLTTRRWQNKKQKGKRNNEGKEMDLITHKHFAKSNPGMFREKILTAYSEIVAELKRRYPDCF